MPYPGLFGLHVQLADLHVSYKNKSTKESVFQKPHFKSRAMLSYPVWYEMVKTQGIGVCVILPTVPPVVDIRKLKCYKTKKKHKKQE